LGERSEVFINEAEIAIVFLYLMKDIFGKKGKEGERTKYICMRYITALLHLFEIII